MSEPQDPRYSLANERTFLAWIRTALGFLAAAAGVVAVDPPWPSSAIRALAVGLALAAGGSAILAWRRWYAVEAAIAAGTAPPPSRAHLALAVTVGAVAVVVMVLVVL